MAASDALKTATGTKVVSPVANLAGFLDKHKKQIESAIAGSPHLNPDRMIRLAMTAFSNNAALHNCDIVSMLGAIITSGQLGLEIGVTGHSYLVPYKGKVQLIPGWQGLVDLVSRSGRGTVWTGAVFPEDLPDFDYGMGDRPFIQYKKNPGPRNPDKLYCTFAVGWVKGADFPIIDVWFQDQLKAHRDQYNKVGSKHYSYDNWEMYGRKIPLLQVIKYLPKSVQLAAALDLESAAEGGFATIDGAALRVEDDPPAGDQNGSPPADQGQKKDAPKNAGGPTLDDAFKLVKEGKDEEARDLARQIGGEAPGSIEATITSRNNNRQTKAASTMTMD